MVKGWGELTLILWLLGISEGSLDRCSSPKNSKLSEVSKYAKLYELEGEEQTSWQHLNYFSPVSIPNNSLLSAMMESYISWKKS